ncbi:MAG: helix-turn-helix domain-containing protein [Balneolaceae bacterium]
MLVSEIGKQIKERRDVLGITQPDLAEMAGVNVNTVYNIESCKGNPTFKKLNRIAEILGMELTLSVKKPEL